jgi:uncharacterized membrane protein
MTRVAAFILVWGICLAAWGTHIIFCLENGRWGFLIAGALAFPVAIVHGVMIWCGPSS